VETRFSKAKAPPGEGGAFKKAMWEHRNRATRRNMLIRRHRVTGWDS